METKTVRMPYGRGFTDLQFPMKNLQESYIPKEPSSLADEEKEIEMVLKSPIKTQALSTMIDPQDRVAIVIDDVTRPTPSYKIIPAILDELGTTNKNITIIVATGLHRKNTEDELKALLGHDILNKVKVVNHDAFNRKGLAYVGETSRGTKLEINKLVRDADLIITTGHIEPHEYAGFTGGSKSILPGVAGVNSINHNHRIENLDHPKAKIGILEGNPVHKDMVEAAKMVGVDFMVNVVLNSRREIAKVVAGDLPQAHLEGVKFYRKYYQVKIGEPADIVITSSGYPGDINFYQSIKSIIAAEPFVKVGGIIVLLAECGGGFGTRLFYELMTSFSSRADIIDRIGRDGYRADIDHCYLFDRILERSDIIVVSTQPSVHEMKRSFIRTFASPEEAINDALNRMGKDATILTLPYAQRVVAKY